MATVYRVTNSLQMKSGVAKDSAVNVHNIISQEDGTVDGATFTAWAGTFAAFYQGLQAYLSLAVSASANAQLITIAKLATGEGGRADDTLSPILYQANYSTLFPGGGALPPEVAICISHVGSVLGAPEESGATRPRSRRRGRMYIGPLSSSAMATSAGGIVTVDPGCATAFLDAFEDMAMELSGHLDVAKRASYGVYSPTADTFYSVETAWVDNAPDTIRRRGIAATSRISRDIDLLVDHQGDVTES